MGNCLCNVGNLYWYAELLSYKFYLLYFRNQFGHSLSLPYSLSMQECAQTVHYQDSGILLYHCILLRLSLSKDSRVSRIFPISRLAPPLFRENPLYCKLHRAGSIIVNCISTWQRFGGGPFHLPYLVLLSILNRRIKAYLGSGCNFVCFSSLYGLKRWNCMDL